MVRLRVWACARLWALGLVLLVAACGGSNDATEGDGNADASSHVDADASADAEADSSDVDAAPTDASTDADPEADDDAGADAAVQPVCGNGVLETGEDCDDGDNDD